MEPTDPVPFSWESNPLAIQDLPLGTADAIHQLYLEAIRIISEQIESNSIHSKLVSLPDVDCQESNSTGCFF